MDQLKFRLRRRNWFDLLPPELIIGIFCKLPGKDLAIVGQTCKKFHEISSLESIWLLRCKEEFGIDADKQGVESYRTLYTKVLYPYGHLLGVWQPKIGPYGGLVKIQMKEGMIKAAQFMMPLEPKVYLPVRIKNLFQIRFDPEDDEVYLECLKGKHGPHELEMKATSLTPDREFTVQCCAPQNHRVDVRSAGWRITNYPSGPDISLDMAELAAWIEDEMGVSQARLMHRNYDIAHDLVRMKLITTLSEFDDICSFKWLDPPKPIENMPLQPGVFKGTYGGHGIELICITYEGNRMKGVKISGDPNVPANKMSMEIHLDEPMFLDIAQQESISTLEELDVAAVRPSQEQSGKSQPVHLPIGIEDRGMARLGEKTGLNLKTCRQRFYGTGLIAMSGFRDAERTPAHCIIYNDDVMAFLWLKLRTVSIYSRVKEEVWS